MISISWQNVCLPVNSKMGIPHGLLVAVHSSIMWVFYEKVSHCPFDAQVAEEHIVSKFVMKLPLKISVALSCMTKLNHP